MPALNIRSGGGSPEHELSEKEFRALSLALNIMFDADAKRRLQEALNRALISGSTDFDADARPILEFYDGASKRLKALARYLKTGPKSDDHDVHFMAKYAFDNNRAYKNKNPDLFHLHLIAYFAATDFSRAREAIETQHSRPSPKGRGALKGLDVLVWELAGFAESVGVTPNAAHSEHREEGRARRTPFVEFVDRMRKALGDKLPKSKSSTESIVRRVLIKRADRRKKAAQSCAAAAPVANLREASARAVRTQADEEKIFAAAYGKPEKPGKSAPRRHRAK